MSLPTGAIQTAFLARYRADVQLQTLLVGSTGPRWNMFDATAVPTNQPFPYLTVNPIASQSGTAMTMELDGVDSYFQVSGFTQYPGFSQVRAIMKRVYDLTNRRPLDLSASGFSQFLILFDDEQEQGQNDGQTQLITHRYKMMTQG